jgi:hypothetical protein
MHDLTARKEDLSPQISPRGESRLADIGGYTVDFGTAPAGVKLDAMTYHGLPEEACPCPHWGVLMRGELRVTFLHGDPMLVQAGEAYYLPPGHRIEIVADSEYVEFSPHELHRQTREAVNRNIAAANEYQR